MGDNTSDDLMLLGFSVQLKPTYLAQLEFMKASFEEQIADLKAAYDEHLDTFENNPVGAAVDAYIATINGQFTIEANE
jgi:hypothetical protein